MDIPKHIVYCMKLNRLEGRCEIEDYREALAMAAMQSEGDKFPWGVYDYDEAALVAMAYDGVVFERQKELTS